jgi:hypothetical protein
MKDRPRALAVLVAVFLFGIIIGAAGSFFWLKPSDEVIRPYNRSRPPAPPPQMQDPKKILPQILQMTPEQEAQYDKFIEETFKQLDALRMGQRSKSFEIWSEFNRRLRAILDEEQKKKFDAFRENAEEMRDRDGKEPPPRRGGPDPSRGGRGL